MDYTKFFSINASRRKPSWIGRLRKFVSSPNVLWLAGGLPNPSRFPFSEAKVTLRDGTVINISPETMAAALQYGNKEGNVQLLNYLSDLTQRLHAPPCWSRTKQLITVGQDGLAKAFVMLVDPGDYVIVPRFCSTGNFSELSALNPRYISVEEDEEGMLAEDLRSTLAQLELESEFNHHEFRPKVMYVNPSSNSPSGKGMREQRRRAIYAIACEYDLLILEDDPYYFLHFSDAINFDINEHQDLPPSFLNLDHEGRVIRFDSFSDVVNTGVLTEVITGPEPLVEKILQHVQATVLAGVGLSQALFTELLRAWGVDGFLRHVREVRELYCSRRDAMLMAAEKHLTGLCEWNVPEGGMFLWLKVPGIKGTQGMLARCCADKNLLLAPGNGFTTNPKLPCQYMRACYSTATLEQMDKAFKILADLIREEIQRDKDSPHHYDLL
ncbi:kynurenine/alpha-aminoadipate aminotransferase, mitochondrial-like [Penaeus chinensis]|uniref:kynurenine/alpha-aminoadipate aminotransferase, mitochondrial-like n=1 Tax=Penaeus chinensis TaxID=139456 RepID=UPI001FB77181|nr:kynurenine/alpha-aminoadipate aminotransferase, mitochondrial-like [Penaeus chinensis]